MEELFTELKNDTVYEPPCMLAIGMFDGLHKGHRTVVATLLKRCQALGAVPCILTFSPHPSRVIDMGRPPVDMIESTKSRVESFLEAGVKKVFIKSFTKEFAAKTPDEFMAMLKANFPNLCGIVTGKNFVFGARATGNWESLKALCEARSWEYCAEEGVMLDESRRMSSTEMRAALRKGDMPLYAYMAGKNYTCSGKVVSGKQLGAKIGFATLNLSWNPECKPRFGVYAVLARKAGEDKIYKGVANYGFSPSVGKSWESPMLETHLFETPNFGAGEDIEVELVKFLRAEQKFESVDDLIAQIQKDKNEAQEVLRSV